MKIRNQHTTWLCAGIILITLTSVGRAAFDHVGWKIWNIFVMDEALKESFVQEAAINFLLLNSFAIFVFWAIVSPIASRK
jgi:hypothetical protein